MLALSAPSDKAIRAQVAESVSLIAELDFPVKWENLIDVRVISLFQDVSDRLSSVSAISSLSVSYGLQRQHWCSTDSTFHFPAVALSCTIRSTLH
jgi:hypothetical protein